ncbi:hypothetical protein AC481_02610 [miscellaneous Crenarchaeota group archaeon SMTZ-80]|nr:MAG: hypothetical protein AC481_02610 [miscellaneous Crenarchaeota group archaeon SMTZ-80]
MDFCSKCGKKLESLGKTDKQYCPECGIVFSDEKISGEIKQIHSKSIRLLSSIIAGITGALFLIYMGSVVPDFFDFEPFLIPGEVLFIFAIAGLTFGYYISNAITQLKESYILVSSIFIGMLLSAIFNYPPIHVEKISQIKLIVFILPAIFAFSLNISGAIEHSKSAIRLFNEFCSKISWYVFWLHIGLVYFFPIYLKTLSQPIGTHILYLIFLAIAWAASLYAILSWQQK